MLTLPLAADLQIRDLQPLHPTLLGVVSLRDRGALLRCAAAVPARILSPVVPPPALPGISNQALACAPVYVQLQPRRCVQWPVLPSQLVHEQCVVSIMGRSAIKDCMLVS